jgi:hypothetical protein
MRLAVSLDLRFVLIGEDGSRGLDFAGDNEMYTSRRRKNHQMTFVAIPTLALDYIPQSIGEVSIRKGQQRMLCSSSG